MKKLILALFLIILSACSNTAETENNNDLDYNALYKTMLDNEVYAESSVYFDVEIVSNQLEDGTFRYYVNIDGAKVAMYNVVAMACSVNDLYIDSDVMCPNIGIYEDIQYKMVPNQENVDDHYVKGITLSGISETEAIETYIVVTWNNQTNTENFNEFIKVSIVPEVEEETEDE